MFKARFIHSENVMICTYVFAAFVGGRWGIKQT